MIDKKPINSCRFVGQLYNYSVILAGGHTMGKGELRLVDPVGEVYQPIKLMAWYLVAEELGELEEGQWIHVLSSYNPNEFRGKLYDQFVVSEFKAI